jgi:hypothetical protein
MAAGGFKEFVAGETLDEDEINDFLMQGVLVFAGTAARGSAIPNPVEGQFSFRTDDDVLEFYDSTDWVALSTPPISFDFLVVAGGGCGGARLSASVIAGGGAGAGGLRTSVSGDTSGGGLAAEASLLVAKGGSYTVTVGAGGAGSSEVGGNGSNSVFGPIVSRGGGGGSKSSVTGGADGGSGGAGGGIPPGPAFDLPGRGTFAQGFNGGNGAVSSTASQQNGGGGGGASANGTSGTTGGGGSGGNGQITTIISTSLATSESVGQVSGSDVYFAGGGAGNIRGGSAGAAGLGGGGLDGVAGTINTGGGGGGTQEVTPTATGGSGIVILKYPDTISLTIGVGLTSVTSSSGGFKTTIFKAGTDVISF